MRETICILTVWIVFSQFCNASEISNGFIDGERCYAAGQYVKAQRLFVGYLIKMPTDAKAHYILGNTCVKLGKLLDAEEHYRQTVKLAPDTKIASYAKSQLQILIRQSKLRTQTSTPTTVAKANPSSSREHVSIKETNSQIDDQKQRLTAEFEKNRSLILDEAAARANNASPPSTSFKNWCQSDARQRIDALEIEYKSRLDALENFALNNERSIVNHELRGQTRPNALRSNLNIQNFESETSEGSSETPLVARPAETLSPKKYAH